MAEGNQAAAWGRASLLTAALARLSGGSGDPASYNPYDAAGDRKRGKPKPAPGVQALLAVEQDVIIESGLRHMRRTAAGKRS